MYAGGDVCVSVARVLRHDFVFLAETQARSYFFFHVFAKLLS